MKRFKKAIAVLLAAAMTIASATAVFADSATGTAQTVAGTEDFIDQTVARFNVPTVHGMDFGFLIDPEHLIKASIYDQGQGGAKINQDYKSLSSADISNNSILWKHYSATAVSDADGNYLYNKTISGLGGYSMPLKIQNKGFSKLELSVEVEVTEVGVSTNNKIRNLNGTDFGETTDPSIYLTLKAVSNGQVVTANNLQTYIPSTGAKDDRMYQDFTTSDNDTSGTGIGKNLEKIEFITSADINEGGKYAGTGKKATVEIYVSGNNLSGNQVNGAYQYKLKEDALEAADAREFVICGEANPNANWTDVKSVQPQVTVTWKVKNPEAKASTTPDFKSPSKGVITYNNTVVKSVTSAKMTNSTGTYDGMVAAPPYYEGATVTNSGDVGTITFDSAFMAFYTDETTYDCTIKYVDKNDAEQTAHVSVKP